MSSHTNGEKLNPGATAPGPGGAPPARSRQQQRVGGATSRRKDDGDRLMVALENAVLEILKNGEATIAEKNSAVGMGVKLAAIKHRIHGVRDSEDYFA